MPTVLLVCGSATVARAQIPTPTPLEELERRAAADPDDAEAAYELGLAHHAAHDVEHALTWYHTARTLDPTNTLIHTSLQTALTERGLLQDSLAAFHTTFAQTRAQPAAAFNLALVAERHGLVEEAIHHYLRYVSMAPQAGDAQSIRARVAAMQQSIQHRQVRIRTLNTRQRKIKPGQVAKVMFSYDVRGWGKHNRTGVVEQVSLYRDAVETHRFAQRSIRADGKRYTAKLDILVPPDAAPGTYTLVAQVIAGSRRDDQMSIFTIVPLPVEMPEELVESVMPVPSDIIAVPAFPKRQAPPPSARPAPRSAAPAGTSMSATPAPTSTPATKPSTDTAEVKPAPDPDRKPYPKDTAAE